MEEGPPQEGKRLALALCAFLLTPSSTSFAGDLAVVFPPRVDFFVVIARCLVSFLAPLSPLSTAHRQIQRIQVDLAHAQRLQANEQKRCWECSTKNLRVKHGGRVLYAVGLKPSGKHLVGELLAAAAIGDELSRKKLCFFSQFIRGQERALVGWGRRHGGRKKSQRKFPHSVRKKLNLSPKKGSSISKIWVDIRERRLLLQLLFARTQWRA